MRLRLIVLAMVAALWITAGVGHNVLSEACYESRHSIDREPIVAGGVVGVVLDVAFWPLFVVGDVVNPPDCRPRPVGS